MNYEQYLNNNFLIKLYFTNSFCYNVGNNCKFIYLFKYKIISIIFLKKNFVCLNGIDISFKDDFINIMKTLNIN